MIATAPPKTTPSVQPDEEIPTPRSRAFIVGTGLVVLLVGLAIASASIGAYQNVAPWDVVATVLHRIGLGVAEPTGGPGAVSVADVLWEIRFPRVALTIIVGASLGCAGAIMQGTFRNPLAEPGVIGVSSGAALGAVAVIALGISTFGNWTLSLAAFLAGLVTVFLVSSVARSGGRTEVVTLVLVGIAVNAFAGAIIGLLTYFAEDAELRSITFWSLGSTATATWPKVLAVAPIAIAAFVVAPFFAGKLDLLALGERPARHLGVDVQKLTMVMIVIVALLTASAVAVSGIILFVGLVVPHMLRMLAGPGHRFLVVGSALGGAVVLLGADLVARTIAAPAEVPLGVVTALIGAPVFFFLLLKTRASQGGWS